MEDHRRQVPRRHQSSGPRRSLFWNRLAAALVVITGLAGCGGFQPLSAGVPTRDPAPQTVSAGSRVEGPIRVFWVNSYNSEDRWSLRVRTGMLEALARAGYTMIDGSLVWDSSDLGASGLVSLNEVTSRADRIVDTIHTFEPDIVVISDDEAVRSVLPRLLDLDVPIIYCGVTTPVDGPELTGKAVYGIEERIHALETVKMAQELSVGEGRYLLIGDASVSGKAVTMAAYDELARELPQAFLPFWNLASSWEAWKSVVQSRLSDVDFIVIASYQPLPDSQGDFVSGDAMMAWMLANVPVPVFSLSNAVVVDGAVGGLVSDGYKQGQLAGQIIARLGQDLDGAGTSISADLRVSAGSGTLEDVLGLEGVGGYNRLVINAAAARHWGLRIPTLFPIAAEVYQSLPVVSSKGATGGGL